MSASTVIVIGAGVLGLSTAAELAARGHAVTVVDPGGANASSVAAGMIAPAMETLGDLRAGAERADLFRAAAALWPDFARRFGVQVHDDGAEWRGEDAAWVFEALRSRGFDVRLTPSGVFMADEARTDAAVALAALRRAPGVTSIAGRAVAVARDPTGWTVRLEAGGRLIADHVVLATGFDAGMEAPPSVAAVLARVSPIKGQLAFTPAALTPHPVRGPGGYVTPVAGGSVIGATMQAGRSDLEPDIEAGRALVEAGLAMAGAEETPPLEWRVGVRGASPDGLPMAGEIEPGLHVALAPRRNGWLTGPLVAAVVADGIEERASHAWGAPLDPRRFD